MDLNKIYMFSELSFASYSSSLEDNMSSAVLKVSLQTDIPGVKFTDYQADLFIDKYNVISHQETADSGFSATLFQGSGEEYILSLRGTENPFLASVDWYDANFGDIGGDGIATTQAIDLFNYYQRLKAKDGETIFQYQYIEETHTITSVGFITRKKGDRFIF